MAAATGPAKAQSCRSFEPIRCFESRWRAISLAQLIYVNNTRSSQIPLIRNCPSTMSRQDSSQSISHMHARWITDMDTKTRTITSTLSHSQFWGTTHRKAFASGIQGQNMSETDVHGSNHRLSKGLKAATFEIPNRYSLRSAAKLFLRCCN